MKQLWLGAIIVWEFVCYVLGSFCDPRAETPESKIKKEGEP